MDVVIRLNNNPVNNMTALIDLDRVIKNVKPKSVWLVDCQSRYSCHQQDEQVLEGLLCNQGH